MSGGVAVAQTQRTVQFTATINPGALLTDVRDNQGRSILEPTVSMGKVSNSVQCRSQDKVLRATLGHDDQRIYVDNPKAAYDGWTLSIAPASGRNATWQSENHSFDFNDGGEGGCIDSDDDGVGGLMSVDPSRAKINADCLECSTEHISVGSAAKQRFSEQDALTLLKASESSDELGSWFMTDVQVEQTIPAGQEGDTYTIDMVLTATAT